MAALSDRGGIALLDWRSVESTGTSLTKVSSGGRVPLLDEEVRGRIGIKRLLLNVGCCFTPTII